MIIYIHGFASSGMGSKAQAFREYFKMHAIDFFAPSLSPVPQLAIQTLSDCIAVCQRDKPLGLIGSSLGGFYAMHLAEQFNLKAVLINPAIRPDVLLMNEIGQVQNFYDGAHFEWQKHHAESLSKFVVNEPKPEHYLLMLQKGDEVLDYRQALKTLPSAETILEEGGDHSFKNIEQHFERVYGFLASEEKYAANN